MMFCARSIRSLNRRISIANHRIRNKLLKKNVLKCNFFIKIFCYIKIKLYICSTEMNQLTLITMRARRRTYAVSRVTLCDFTDSDLKEFLRKLSIEAAF